MKMDIEKVVEVVKDKGPLLPNVIAKHFNERLLIASATLSQLISLKKIKLTHTKIGGSPLYYAPGQEEKLPDMLKDEIKKEYKQAFEQLRDCNVLWDKKLPKQDRIALRNLKDFAKPWLVKDNGNEELFWVWFLSEEEKVKSLIEEIVRKETEKTKEEAKNIKVLRDEKKTSEIIKNQALKSEEDSKSEKKNKTDKENKDIESEKETNEKNIDTDDKNIEYKNKLNDKNKIKEKKSSDREEHDKNEKSFSNVPDVNLSKLLNEWSELKKKVARLEKENKEEKEKRIKHEKQSQLVEKDDEIKLTLNIEDPTHNKLSDFLEKNNIEMNEIEDMKKTSIGFSAKMNTPVGIIPLWVRVLLKKRVNDKDIEALFGESNLHRVQGLLLYNGSFTKKATNIIEKYNILSKKFE